MNNRQHKTKGSGSDMVAAALLERILKAEWQVGEKIPSVDQLEKVLPASRVTICKGIQKLCRQGYLHSAWRSGTYVSSAVLVRRILVHTGGDQALMQEYPFGRVVTRKVEARLVARGMQAEIHWEASQPLAGSRLAADLVDGHFAGGISVASSLPVLLTRELPTMIGRIPFVHVGCHRQVPSVGIDVTAFHRQAAALCRERGDRNVLYFAPPAGPRQDEFARLATGLRVWTPTPADGDWPSFPTEQEAYALFLRVWQRLGSKIDAVVVGDDIQAKGMVQALLALAAAGARHLHLVAMTNKDSGIFYPLPVDAVEVDTDEIANQAVALLEQQFAEGLLPADVQVLLAPRPVAMPRPLARPAARKRALVASKTP